MGRQDGGRGPVMIPWGNVLYSTFMPAAEVHGKLVDVDVHVCLCVQVNGKKLQFRKGI